MLHACRIRFDSLLDPRHEDLENLYDAYLDISDRLAWISTDRENANTNGENPTASSFAKTAVAVRDLVRSWVRLGRQPWWLIPPPEQADEGGASFSLVPAHGT
jgi:hypothetical protein